MKAVQPAADSHEVRVGVDGKESGKAAPAADDSHDARVGADGKESAKAASAADDSHDARVPRWQLAVAVVVRAVGALFLAAPGIAVLTIGVCLRSTGIEAVMRERMVYVGAALAIIPFGWRSWLDHHASLRASKLESTVRELKQSLDDIEKLSTMLADKLAMNATANKSS